MKNNRLNIFHGYLCELKKEGYMMSLYVVEEVMLVKKKEKYYNILTEETYNVIEVGEDKVNNLKEGYYFSSVEPLNEYLKSKESSNQRKRKKKNV